MKQIPLVTLTTAAAHLTAGVPITALGPPARDPVTFPPPRLEIAPDGISGEALHADHFGNLVTSIGRLMWSGNELSLDPAFQKTEGKELIRFKAGEATVTVTGQEIAGVHRTYAEVEPGQTLILVDSEGYLEIAVREGSAARRLGLNPGDAVTLHIQQTEDK